MFEEEVVGGVEPKIEIFLYRWLVDVGFAYEGIAESDILVEAFVWIDYLLVIWEVLLLIINDFFLPQLNTHS